MVNLLAFSNPKTILELYTQFNRQGVRCYIERIVHFAYSVRYTLRTYR